MYIRLHQFAGFMVLQCTLVGRPREKVGCEGQQQVHSKESSYEPDDKMRRFTFEKEGDTPRF
jgi:hypothetical protein